MMDRVIYPKKDIQELNHSEKYLTGIFFWAIATTQSVPRTATVVKPPWLIALNAYSELQEKD